MGIRLPTKFAKLERVAYDSSEFHQVFESARVTKACSAWPSDLERRWYHEEAFGPDLGFQDSQEL